MAELAAPEVHERFQIEHCLGEGASGVVFRALDTSRGVTVAVKVLTRLDASSLLRFKGEFRSLANITHPNLLQLFDLVVRGHEWLLSMELIEGCDFLAYVRPASADTLELEEHAGQSEVTGLDSFHTMTMHGQKGSTPVAPVATLEKKRASYGALSEPRLRSALLQLSEGLEALHRENRLHRDLKPANVLVSTAEDRVVICDFGLVVEGRGQHRTGQSPANDDGRPSGEFSAQGSSHGSSHGEIAGTLAYMSPEQATGKTIDGASDWYSVGVMLYQALTLSVPFDTKLPFLQAVQQRLQTKPKHVLTLAPDAPRDLADLAMALLETEPSARPGYAEIVRRLQGNSASQLRALSSHTLIGREQELAQLQQAFFRARGGQATVALVSGRSGMGKSALMRSFLDDVLKRENAVVLSARCYEREDLPYKAFDPLLDALSSYLLLLEPAFVEELLPAGIQSLARLFPVLNRVPAVAMRELASSQPADQLEQKKQGFVALRELLRRVAQTRPLVLYIDDLQWGDLDSGPLFTELLRPPQAPAMLVVCAYRSEDEKQSALLLALRDQHFPAASIQQPVRLELSALSDSHTRQLANALLEGTAGADAAAELVTREAGGSPFFVGELSSFIRQAGRLASSDLKLDNVIESRLLALPTDSRHLLSVIAVAGRPERRVIINTASELGPRSFQALRVLESQHLVQSTGATAHDRIEAYHDRIRETAYRLLGSEARRALHERLAQALEAKGDADHEALLDHFRNAGKHKRAGEYAIKAAEKAEHALAFGRAAMMYREAMTLLEAEGEERRALDERLGHALMLSGHGVEAADAFFRAVPGAKPARAMELRSLGTIQLLRSGVVDRAFRELSGAEDILLMRTPLKPLQAIGMLLWRRLKIRLLGLRLRKPPARGVPTEMVQRMDMLWGIGGALSPIDQLRGNVYQAEHLLLAIKAGDPYRFARALAMETTVYGTANLDQQKIQRLIEMGLEIGGASREPHAISAVKGTSGVVRMLGGRFREAVRLTREAQDIVREHLHGTLAWDRVIMVLFELRAHSMLGNVRELSERIPEFLREADGRGDLYAAVSARTAHLCWAWLGPDQPEQALAHVKSADQQWVQEGYHLQHWYTTQAYGEVGLYRDDVDDAHARLMREWKAMFIIRSKIQFTRAELLYLRSRMMLALARKHNDLSRLELVRGDIKTLQKEKSPWIAAHARLLTACVESFGNREGASKLLHEVEGQFEAVDMSLHAAVCCYRRGQLASGPEGKALMDEAEARMRVLGVVRPEGFARMLAPGFPGSPT